MNAKEQVQALLRGVVDVHVAAELEARLQAGQVLRVKAGFDPTRPDLHLGHAVLLRKLRQFQDFGHQVLFIVGDFTAQIGDPSGRSATRPVPTRAEIEAGAQSYAEQALRILKPAQTEVVFNSHWLGAMRFADVIQLAGKYTLARMMERDDFKRRFAEHVSIGLHELLYPLVQGYDSVHLQPDVELGGTDQLFNLLVGRELMRERGQRPQVVMTVPILEGLGARVEDGKLVGDKMSKSLGNHIALTEAPEAQFGKLMRINDMLMWRYYALLSARSADDIAALQQACAAGTHNPRDAKLALAQEIVAALHDPDAARTAQDAWLRQFSRGEVPEDIPAVRVDSGGEAMWLPKVLALAGLVPSSTEGRRRVSQGGVEVDAKRITDPKATLRPGQRYRIKAGKRAWADVDLV
ncbi:MAG: tyrosine--tRNA ligase [Polyangiales bacterium]